MSGGRPSIIYIQSDHGPGSKLNWDDAAKSDLRERFGILLAARFARGNQARFYQGITPINAMRVVLNDALDLAWRLEADRSYFSSWRNPSEFLEVTATLR